MSPVDLGVPERARREWTALGEAILATGPTPCSGPDRDDWTGTRAQQARAADRCLDCRVMAACALYSRVADERHGVWGGRDEWARKGRAMT